MYILIRKYFHKLNVFGKFGTKLNRPSEGLKGSRGAFDLYPVCLGYTASLESKIWTPRPADHQRCMLQRSMGCLVTLFWSWTTKRWVSLGR